MPAVAVMPATGWAPPTVQPENSTAGNPARAGMLAKVGGGGSNKQQQKTPATAHEFSMNSGRK
jgi:hypothetical protein